MAAAAEAKLFLQQQSVNADLLSRLEVITSHKRPAPASSGALSAQELLDITPTGPDMQRMLTHMQADLIGGGGAAKYHGQEHILNAFMADMTLAAINLHAAAEEASNWPEEYLGLQSPVPPGDDDYLEDDPKNVGMAIT